MIDWIELAKMKPSNKKPIHTREFPRLSFFKGALGEALESSKMPLEVAFEDTCFLPSFV